MEVDRGENTTKNQKRKLIGNGRIQRKRVWELSLSLSRRIMEMHMKAGYIFPGYFID